MHNPGAHRANPKYPVGFPAIKTHHARDADASYRGHPHREKTDVQSHLAQQRLEHRAGGLEDCHLLSDVIGGVVGLKEYTYTHERERREIAQQAYHRADVNFNEFLKLCVAHPDLDCYPGSELLAPEQRLELDPLKQVQHRALYMILIDTFEVAYVNYNTDYYATANPASYCAQWPGWISELKQYARRAEFRSTWNEVGDEFDSNFARCFHAILAEQDAGRGALADSPPPADCMSPQVPCDRPQSKRTD